MKSVLTQSCISNNCELSQISFFSKSLKWLWTLPVVIITFFNCQQPHPPETLLQVGAIQVSTEKLMYYLKNFRQKPERIPSSIYNDLKFAGYPIFMNKPGENTSFAYEGEF